MDIDDCCEKRNKYIRVRQPRHNYFTDCSFCIFYANASLRNFWISSTFLGAAAALFKLTLQTTRRRKSPSFPGGRLEFLLKCAFAPLQSSYRNSHVAPLTCDSGIADMTTRNQQQRSGEVARAESLALGLFVEDVLLKVKCQDVRHGRMDPSRSADGRREGGLHRGWRLYTVIVAAPRGDSYCCWQCSTASIFIGATSFEPRYSKTRPRQQSKESNLSTTLALQRALKEAGRSSGLLRRNPAPCRADGWTGRRWPLS